MYLPPLDPDRLDHHIFERPVAVAGRRAADLPDDVHALDHLAKDRMAVVEMRRRSKRDEELSAVGVRPAVGHRQDPRLVVPRLRVELVREGIAGTADPLAQRIAALNHESVDHAVEDDAVVIRLTYLSIAARIGPLLRALGEPDEVFDSLGRFLIE